MVMNQLLTFNFWHCTANISSRNAFWFNILGKQGFIRFSQFDIGSPKLDFDLHQKQFSSFTQFGAFSYFVWGASMFPLILCLNTFTLLPVVTQMTIDLYQKQVRVLLLKMRHPHAKHENHERFPSCDIWFS